MARPKTLFRSTKIRPGNPRACHCGRVRSVFVAGHHQDQGPHVDFVRTSREDVCARVSKSRSGRERHRAEMVQDEQGRPELGSCSVVPLMLMHRPSGTGAVGRSELCHRADEFARGHWSKLVNDALRNCPYHARLQADRSQLEEQVWRGKAAQARVHCGQVSRARQDSSSQECSHVARVACEETSGAIAGDSTGGHGFVPRRCEVGRQVVGDLSESAPSGSSPGPGRCTNEMLRVCLDDHEALLLLTSAAEDFARASVPEGIFNCFSMATMTALQKPEGGVRGVATSTSFRRLVA